MAMQAHATGATNTCKKGCKKVGEVRGWLQRCFIHRQTKWLEVKGCQMEESLIGKHVRETCWHVGIYGYWVKFFLPRLDFNLGLALAPLSIFRTSTNRDRTITNQDRAAANRDRNANRYSLFQKVTTD